MIKRILWVCPERTGAPGGSVAWRHRNCSHGYLGGWSHGYRRAITISQNKKVRTITALQILLGDWAPAPCRQVPDSVPSTARVTRRCLWKVSSLQGPGEQYTLLFCWILSSFVRAQESMLRRCFAVLSAFQMRDSVATLLRVSMSLWKDLKQQPRRSWPRTLSMDLWNAQGLAGVFIKGGTVCL